MSDPLIGPGVLASGWRSYPTPGGGGHSTLAGMFNDRAKAERARAALLANGVPPDHIDMTTHERGDHADGLWDRLKRWFSGDHAGGYHDALHDGQVLLTVRAQSPDDADRLAEVLRQFQPADLET